MAIAEPLGFWNLSNVNDAKNGYTLTNTNTVAFNAGKIGNAADTGASNTNKRLETTSFIGLTASSNYTFNFWFNVTTQPGSGVEAGLLSWCDNSTALGRMYYQVKQYNNAGTQQLYITRNNVTVQDQVGANQTLTTGTWYMLTNRWDGSTHTLCINANTTPLLTQASVIVGVSSSSNGGTDGLKLFCEQDSTTFSSGLMDMLGVWNSAISDADMTSLYNGGTGLEYPFSSATVSPRKALLGVGV